MGKGSIPHSGRFNSYLGPSVMIGHGREISHLFFLSIYFRVVLFGFLRVVPPPLPESIYMALAVCVMERKDY